MKTELNLFSFAFIRGVLGLLHLVEHDVGDLVGDVGPQVDDLVVALGLQVMTPIFLACFSISLISPLAFLTSSILSSGMCISEMEMDRPASVAKR